MLLESASGTTRPLVNEIWASAISKGDTKTRIVGGGVRHYSVIEIFALNCRKRELASVFSGVDDSGCQATLSEIQSYTCHDLLERRSQNEMEPERRRLAAAFHFGNTLVDKRESLRCLVSNLYNRKTSALEVRRHLTSTGEKTLLRCRGPGRWVLWLFCAG